MGYTYSYRVTGIWCHRDLTLNKTRKTMTHTLTRKNKLFERNKINSHTYILRRTIFSYKIKKKTSRIFTTKNPTDKLNKKKYFHA